MSCVVHTKCKGEAMELTIKCMLYAVLAVSHHYFSTIAYKKSELHRHNLPGKKESEEVLRKRRTPRTVWLI